MAAKVAEKPTAQFIVREASRLHQERSAFEGRWQNIRRYIWPDSPDFFGGDGITQTNRLEILDNSTEEAAELAAAGLHGYLTNPATDWVELSLFDQALAESYGPALWLQQASKRLKALFLHPDARFAVASHECYREAIAFGNWCMFVEERPGKLPLFRAIPIADIVWDENEDGEIVKVWRRFSLTLWAAYEKFGEDLPEPLLKLYRDGLENRHKRVKFYHHVCPRKGYDEKIANGKNKPFASYWIAPEYPDDIIREGGYDELPYICGRWHKQANELYGRGCGDKALPDAAMLQRGMRAVIRGAEIAVTPPMVAPDDGMLKRLNLRPFAVNYVRADYLAQNAGPKPLLTGGRVDIGLEVLEAVRDRIKVAFLKDLMQLLRDPEATATQVLEIKEEQMRGMSPILGRITQDWLGPLVIRAFGCLQRAGGFEDLETPREIVGLTPKPVFISPAARAQQIAEARGIVQGFESTAGMLSMDNTLPDNVDLDIAFRTVIRAIGTPLIAMRDPKIVAQMRQARAQQAQQMRAEESLKNQSAALKNATGALKVVADKVAPDAQPAEPQAMAA